MTTCAPMRAANEPARLWLEDGAWLRRDVARRALRSVSEERARPVRCRRSADKTLDAPVSNVSTSILVGDPQEMLLPVGNGSESQSSHRKNLVGPRPAPNVFPSNVSGRSSSGSLQPPSPRRSPEGRAASLLRGAARSRPVCCRRNADETLDAPVSNVPTTIPVGDANKLPLSVGTEARPSRRAGKTLWGPRPAPNVFPSNVFGRRCSMAPRRRGPG
jgi:hypothetical protein